MSAVEVVERALRAANQHHDEPVVAELKRLRERIVGEIARGRLSIDTYQRECGRLAGVDEALRIIQSQKGRS